MNKKMKTMAVSLLAACLMIPGFASAAEMNMKVDYSKFMMVEKNGETWVPLRQIASSLGYTVTWSKMEGIMLTKKAMMQDVKDMDMMAEVYTITLMPGHKDFMVGMDKMMLMQAPIVMKNTTYVTKDFIETYLVTPMMMDK
ncbi:stalk domain-containing protein [Cohnella luojiensis]|uniref:stalk domain-containing protein n=1 Tax=Cohnella luojiensis TaxID=652876 RepID=UPI0014321EFC|nr:stalk domain-containing protein [Cohnella luojiensis]